MSLSEESAVKIIFDSLEGLVRSKTIESDVSFGLDTVLLGAWSVLDSIGFVTFVTDIEDRLEESTGEERYIVLNEINEFSIDTPELTVKIFSQYLVKLVNN
jgi:hypothetical protein